MKRFMNYGLLRSIAPRVRVIAAVAIASLVAASCDVHGISGPGTMKSIVVSPNPQILQINGVQQFIATGTDFEGKSITFTPEWSVVTGGGAITSAGVFTAGTGTGTFTNTVKATFGGLSSTGTVIVTAGPLASIVVTPNPMSLAVGATQQYSAVGKDAAGNVVQFTPTWSVVASGGTISPTGLFTAGTATGTFANTVRATSGSINGSATVTVTAGALASIAVIPNPVSLAVSSSQRFVAVGRDANGNVVAITPTWSVIAGGGTIATDGLFTAGTTPGTYENTIRATSGGVSGLATVTVTGTVGGPGPNAALATITVTPNPVILLANGAQQFTAVGRDGDGNVFPITAVWSVVNGGGTINSSTGVFTAGAVAGTYTNTVTATSGSISGSATVIVTTAAPVLATITVSPNPATMSTGGTQQFTAFGRDANGNSFPIVAVWSVVNGGGTINAGSGLFTAGAIAATYTNTVRATSGAISGTATVIVTSPPVSSLINLGTAAANGIMAGTAVTCVNLGVINANVSISPGNTITGFGPCVITGVQHLNDAVAIQAQLDLTSAYNQLAGLPCPPANIISANLGGTTKTAGVYCSATTIGVTGVLTLDGGGDPNATFVFQAGSGLTTAGDVVLINGAQAKNVYWLVGSSATIGTASQWQGNIIALTSITLVDTATLRGRALARNGAVSLGTGNTITLP